MANIITMLDKEIEKKNNLYIDCKGNTITPEKIEDMAKKSYVQDLKAGVVDFETPFASYHANILMDYIPLMSLRSVIMDTIKYPVLASVDSLPPAENAEPVAN